MTNGRGLEKVWRSVLLRDPCVYCGGIAENLDHISPASLKGRDDWENRAPTCVECNSRPGNVKLAIWLLALHCRGNARDAKQLADAWRWSFAKRVGISVLSAAVDPVAPQSTP